MKEHPFLQIIKLVKDLVLNNPTAFAVDQTRTHRNIFMEIRGKINPPNDGTWELFVFSRFPRNSSQPDEQFAIVSDQPTTRSLTIGIGQRLERFTHPKGFDIVAATIKTNGPQIKIAFYRARIETTPPFGPEEAKTLLATSPLVRRSGYESTLPPLAEFEVDAQPLLPTPLPNT